MHKGSYFNVPGRNFLFFISSSRPPPVLLLLPHFVTASHEIFTFLKTLMLLLEQFSLCDFDERIPLPMSQILCPPTILVLKAISFGALVRASAYSYSCSHGLTVEGRTKVVSTTT